jgi:hypothetical protein
MAKVTKVRWMNPLDAKTSDHCKQIFKRTANGVSLEELKGIVREEADKDWYKSTSPFLPHPQCRSAIVVVR